MQAEQRRLHLGVRTLVQLLADDRPTQLAGLAFAALASWLGDVVEAEVAAQLPLDSTIEQQPAQQLTQLPEDPQQPAAPQHAKRAGSRLKRTQAAQGSLEPDQPLPSDKLLKALAPRVAACLQRRDVMDAVDRLGACSSGPRLAYHIWQCDGGGSSASVDVATAVQLHCCSALDSQ